MSYAAIAFTIPQYDKSQFANWWLKAYIPSTTTPKLMATDASGGTTVSRFELDITGLPVTAGNAKVIPFIDGAYDLWAFPTAAEADANDTSNAEQFADNINASEPSGFTSSLGAQGIRKEATVAAMVALTNISAGDTVDTIEYSAGNGGGARYSAEALGTPDGFGDHASTGTAGIQWTLQNKETATSTQYGANPDGATDSTADIVAAYAVLDELTIDADHAVTNFTVSKPTRFIGSAKLIVTGTLTINAEIIADNNLIFDLTAATTYTVDGSAIHEIKNKWFSATEYGSSQTVYGNKAGAALLGQKAINGTDYNVFHGFRCGEKTDDALESAFFGTYAGASCLTAQLSTGLGYGALRGKENPGGSGLFDNVVATNTTAIGQGALQDGTSHTTSVAVGSGAGKEIPVSIAATIIGGNAARLSGSLSNVLFAGAATGYNWGSTGVAADSQYTTLLGSDIGFNVTQGARSTLVGSRAGLSSTTSDDNTWVGYLTGPDSGSFSTVADSICLGSAARTRQADTITIGNSITNTVAGRTHIGNASSTSALIQGIYSNTNAGAANVFIDSAGVIYRSTSSLKYKDVIEPMRLEWAYKTLEFEPILYKPTENAENEAWTYYGYGAEQVAEIDPRFAQMAREPIGIDEETGQAILADEATPNGVMYDRIVTAQGLIIKDLLARIEALENK